MIQVAKRLQRASTCFAPLLLAAAALAGCGGHPRRASAQPSLPRPLAQRLAAQSDDVAARLDVRDECGALAAARSLQQETIGAINAHSVPGALQEPLSSAAARVVARIRCTPNVSPAPHAEPLDGEGDRGHDHGRAKKEHGGKHGDEGGDNG